MVQQTCLGAAQMAKESDLSLEDLRKQVTSKGGSTAKGVEAYQDSDLHGISDKAVKAAVNRNQEMAKLF
jgi:pyrroline-5-carboxylate reductase